MLIGSRPPYLLARRLARRYPAAAVLVITARGTRASAGRIAIARAASIGTMRRLLEEWGAPDLVICESELGPDAPAGRMVRTVLPMIADGGRLVLIDGPASPEQDESETGAAVVARLAELSRELADGPVSEAHADDLARARCIAAVEEVAGLLVVRRRGHAFIKVRDRRADAVLTGRLGEGWGRELSLRARREFQARSALRVNDPGVPNEFRPRFEVPPRHLRLYRDAICTPRQLVVVGDVIAPISFHHPCARRLNNRQSVDVGPHAATSEVPLEGAPHLRGTYYHLVSEFPSHFGHFMTEDLARLWGWDLACAEFDDLRLLLSVRKPGDEVPPFVLEMLRAYGIGKERISVIDEPTQIERLIGATPQFHNGQYVDPDIEQVWARIAGRLVDRVASTPERIFVVRPPGMARRCHNGAAVEAEFVAHGFAVVQPGDLSIADQATLFAGAQVIAGYGGSAQFNSIFHSGPTTRIVIASESYYASNEWLISAVKGDDYHHFWCQPDVPRGATYETASFHSDFTFDFDRDGGALTDVM